MSRVHATDGVVVEGFDNTPIKFAKCCSHLPGDPIVGFITRGFGVSIHKQSCANAVSSMKDPSNAPRWVKAYWADSVKDSYKAGLEIIALNRNELLSDVLAALADIRVVEVKDDFPRLTPGSVPLGVTKATYEIDLDKVLGPSIPTADALKKLGAI